MNPEPGTPNPEQADILCQFCQGYCMVPLITAAPPEIVEAYISRGVNVLATCPGGQALEKPLLGYCFADLEAAVPDYLAQVGRLARGEAEAGLAIVELKHG